MAFFISVDFSSGRKGPTVGRALIGSSDWPTCFITAGVWSFLSEESGEKGALLSAGLSNSPDPDIFIYVLQEYDKLPRKNEPVLRLYRQ